MSHKLLSLPEPKNDLRRLHVTAVLVSYNRKALLKEAVSALAAQTVPVDRLIIVDNNSTDGATELAADAIASWGKRGRLLALSENTGGAGGFAAGVAAALLPDHSGQATDWIWVMDDDTIVHPTALEKALDAHRRFAAGGSDSLAVMGSKVQWIDGSEHPMNTPKAKIGASAAEKQRATVADAMPIRSISFVSAFLRASRVAAEGLPVADYFLWNDDFEYSARLLNGARGLYVPDSVVTHKTKNPGSSTQDPGPRFFYEVRNKLWVFAYSRALKPWERCAYTVATLRRWLRTFKASSNTAVLREELMRGVRKAAQGRPVGNTEILGQASLDKDVLAVVSALEKQTFSTVARRR